MIRLLIIIIIIILIGLYTIFDYAIFSIVSIFDKELVLRHSESFVRFIFKVALFVSGVRIHVKGKENIYALNNVNSYFIVSNHRGFFDIISGYVLFDKHVGIVAKKSIAKVPVISYWMKRINCIFLDRKDIRDGMRMILQSIENINNGITMWIFPEGTRCKSTNPLDILEFKAGAFKIAEKTNCYILPISFMNTEKAFENQKPFIKPTNIYINIGKAYKISDLNEDDKINISNYNQELIKKLLLEDKNGR